MESASSPNDAHAMPKDMSQQVYSWLPKDTHGQVFFVWLSNSTTDQPVWPSWAAFFEQALHLWYLKRKLCFKKDDRLTKYRPVAVQLVLHCAKIGQTQMQKHTGGKSQSRGADRKVDNLETGVKNTSRPGGNQQVMTKGRAGGWQWGQRPFLPDWQ